MLYRPKNKSTNILVDLSPLIDVVFLLLIFFMVSTRFKDDHGMDLSLPSSESSKTTKGESLVIMVGKDKEIRIDGEVVTEAQLEQVIGAQWADYETKNVVIKADKQVDHGYVVTVMVAAKKAGAEGLTFATSSAPAKDAKP